MELWNPELFKDARLFLQSATILHFRLLHMVQIGNIPSLDEAGTKIVQSYFDQIKDRLGRDFEQVLNKSKMLVSLREQVTEKYNGSNTIEYLQLAAKQLSEIFDKLT